MTRFRRQTPLHSTIDMKNYILWNALGLLVIYGSSCSSPEESPALQEARAVHETLTQLSSTLHDDMVATLQALKLEVEAHADSGDSLVVMRLSRLEASLSNLDVRFHDWSATVVEIPGETHDHSGHGHDHSGHGHDHSGHDHDHGSGASLEGMSDDDILAIQQALLAELKTMEAQLDATQLAWKESH